MRGKRISFRNKLSTLKMHLNAGWHIFSPQIINDFFMSFSSHLQSDRWWLWGPKLDNFDVDEILWLHSGQWKHLTLSRATGMTLHLFSVVTRLSQDIKHHQKENIWDVFFLHNWFILITFWVCNNIKGPIKSDARCILNLRVSSEQHI